RRRQSNNVRWTCCKSLPPCRASSPRSQQRGFKLGRVVVMAITTALPIMEEQVHGLTGRLWILFQTITSEYDQGQLAAGAAGGKQCGDAGLAQVLPTAPAAQCVRPLLRRKVPGDGDCNLAAPSSATTTNCCASRR